MNNKGRKALTLFDDYYEMLSDSVRMKAYRKAIFETVKKGDIVIDMGAGLGILTFFALAAGASKVYAIEMRDSIHLARRIAEKNGLSSKIVFLNENSRNVTLPEKADVLISETLGSFAIEENTIEYTIDARERLLKEGGRMIPEKLKMFLAPVEVPHIRKKMERWKDVYGVDFSPALDDMTRKMLVEEIRTEDFLAEPDVYMEIDLSTITTPSIAETVVFKALRAGTLHGFSGWFAATLSPSVTIDTSPRSPKTHWAQAFFPVKEPVNVNPSSIMAINMRTRAKEAEGDDTIISYDFMLLPGDNKPTSKPGRNDPCHCGSGKKYKKCCGA